MPSLEIINAAPPADYLALLESLYEYSPWIVERSASSRPFLSIAQMQARFESIILGAAPEEQRSLLVSHPDLAAKIEQLDGLTDFSRAEQSRAGFASLPKPVLDELRRTLSAYRDRFGHPFILCVSDHEARETLPILRARIDATPETERQICLFQVTRIGWHRLQQLVSAPPSAV